MRIVTPPKTELNETAEKIYRAAFSNYISPSNHEKREKLGQNFESFPFGGGSKDKVLDRIKALLSRGNSVLLCGYMSTSIKGYHSYYIIWKP